MIKLTNDDENLDLFKEGHILSCNIIDTMNNFTKDKNTLDKNKISMMTIIGVSAAVIEHLAESMDSQTEEMVSNKFIKMLKEFLKHNKKNPNRK
jgi:Ca2+-binding EF-hand superfamily protein